MDLFDTAQGNNLTESQQKCLLEAQHLLSHHAGDRTESVKSVKHEETELIRLYD